MLKWFFSIVFYCTPLIFVSAEEFNAGFVEGIWFSDESVFVDEPIRIYAAIRNNTGADLTGTVEFFIDSKRIERSNVSALDNRIIESWADWTPTYGEHTIAATLSRVELSTVSTNTKNIHVVSAEATRTIFVDYDTDGDGIGNKDDTDDDGDGHSDVKEKEHGSDPLDPEDPINEPEDTKTDSNKQDTDNMDSNDAAVNRGNGASDGQKNNGPEGLERYLTDSRADRVLASMTDTINTTKKHVDAYRSERSNQTSVQDVDDAAESQGDSAASSTINLSDDSSSSVQTNENGFGEVERTKATESESFVYTIWDFIKKAIEKLYTFILFLISLYLGHPIIVQISLLFLILFILFKIAQRLGRRGQ